MALVVAVLAGLAGGAAVPPAAGAACGLIVVWHDRAYWGFGGGPAESDGKRLDGAVEPGCNDTAGANERPSAVAARTIPAVPPAVAIFSEGHTLVASGYFIEPSDLRVGDAAVRSTTRRAAAPSAGPCGSSALRIPGSA